MIHPVGGSSLMPQFEASERVTPEKKPTAHGDIVSISDKAISKHKAEFSPMPVEAPQSENSPWKLPFSLKDGTFNMENGHTQKVSVDGDSIEVFEYDNGRLVKSIAGRVTKDGLSLDAEFYDESGRVSRTVHTDIVETEGTKGWTKASMNRSVQWFDKGTLKGEMQDTMLLQTKNMQDDESVRRALAMLSGDGAEDLPSAQTLANAITTEKHIASYHAKIMEYGTNGNLTRDTTLEHDGRYEHASNRSFKKIGNMEKRTTKEMEHKTDLRLSVRDYDSEGNLVRDASFDDTQLDARDDIGKGKQHQNVSVAWYNKGNMVRRSHGSFTLEESESTGLMERPGMRELFGLSDEQYLGSKPQSASDLMMANDLRTGAKPDHVIGAIGTEVSQGGYSMAEKIGFNGSPDQTYYISWEDELFNRDGERVMRQKDTEGARESSFYLKERSLLFRKGGGLTENEIPPTLRESSHEREIYEDGRSKEKQTAESHESVNVDHGGPDKLTTHSVFVQNDNRGKKTTVLTQENGLEAVDNDPNAAARDMGKGMGLTLESLRQSIRPMKSDMEDGATDFIGLDYTKKWS